MSSESLKAIGEFSRGCYLDVRNNQLVTVNKESNSTTEWPQDSIKRVCDYINKHPINDRLPNLSIENCVDLLSSIHSYRISVNFFNRSSSFKAEYAFFKLLFCSITYFETSEPQVKALYTHGFLLHRRSLKDLIVFAALLKFTPKEKYEQSVKNLQIIFYNISSLADKILKMNEGFAVEGQEIIELFFEISQNHEINFYLEFCPKLIKPNSSNEDKAMVLKTLKQLHPTDREDVVQCALLLIKDSFNSLEIAETLIAIHLIKTSDRQNVCNIISRLGIKDSKDRIEFLKLIAIIPEESIDQIRSIYNYLKTFKIELEKYNFFDFIRQSLVCIPKTDVSSTIKRIQDIDLSNFINKQFYIGIISLIPKHTFDFKILNPLLKTYDGNILILTYIWTVLTITPFEHRTLESLQIFLMNLSRIDEYKYIHVAKFYIQLKETFKHLSILSKLCYFISNDELVIRMNEIVSSCPQDRLEEFLDHTISLIKKYNIKYEISRTDILHAVLTTSFEDSENYAISTSRWEQVFIANLLKEEDPEKLDGHLRSLIPNFELYSHYFFNLPTLDLAYLLLEKYSDEITEMAETKFSKLSLSERMFLIPFLKPDHLKRLLTQDDKNQILSGFIDIEDINKPKNSLSKFCLMSFFSPGILYSILPKMDTLKLHLFFKFLSEQTKEQLVHDYSRYYKKHIATLQKLTNLSQANVDVSKELIDTQIAVQELTTAQLILKKFTLPDQIIENNLVQSKKAMDLISAITMRNQDNIPAAFIDPLTSEKMTDPVKLPKPENTYVDRSTLYNPHYFEVAIVNNVTLRKNYFTSLYYPDYTLEENPTRGEPGYELDLNLRQEIENHQSLRRSKRLKASKKT